MSQNRQTKRTLLAQFSFVLFSLAILTCNASAADVYKWTDDDGYVHYSDIKPDNENVENMHIKTSRISKQRSNPQSLAAALDEKRQKYLSKKAARLQQSSLKKENDAKCETIRTNLRKFDENSRIRIEEYGKLRYLSPDEINRKKAEYQAQLDEFCS